MKTLILILFATVAMATTREGDLKVVLEKTYLSSAAEPVLKMIAGEIIEEGKFEMPPEELIVAFRRKFAEQRFLTQLGKPYEERFSDPEMKELRKIYENPVWQKYAQEGTAIMTANIEVMRSAFKELAFQFQSPLGDIWQLTSDTFSQVEKSTIPVVIDVYATWCSACKTMSPIIDQAVLEYDGRVQFAKIDIDAEHDLAKKFKVKGLPTLLFFKPKSKKPAMTHTGVLEKNQLDEKINQLLK